MDWRTYCLLGTGSRKDVLGLKRAFFHSAIDLVFAANCPIFTVFAVATRLVKLRYLAIPLQ